MEEAQIKLGFQGLIISVMVHVLQRIQPLNWDTDRDVALKFNFALKGYIRTEWAERRHETHKNNDKGKDRLERKERKSVVTAPIILRSLLQLKCSLFLILRRLDDRRSVMCLVHAIRNMTM